MRGRRGRAGEEGRESVGARGRGNGREDGEGMMEGVRDGGGGEETQAKGSGQVSERASQCALPCARRTPPPGGPAELY